MSENLLGFREGSGDRCSKWRELAELRKGGQQKGSVCGWRMCGRYRESTLQIQVRKGPIGLPETGLYSGRCGESLEVREQESDMPHHGQWVD